MKTKSRPAARGKQSANPAYPQTHPTAPGGMSQKQLVAELTSEHGWTVTEAQALKWPEQIDAVVEGRLDREREAEGDEFDNPYEAEPETAADAELDELVQEFAAAEDAKEQPGACVPLNSFLVPEPPFIPFGGGDGEQFQLYGYSFNNHAGAGPSAADRWMNCPGSLAMSRAFLETLTENQAKQFALASLAARQGTTAHSAAEAEARHLLGIDSEQVRDTTLNELAFFPEEAQEAYDDSMGEYIQEYVDLIQTLVDEGRTILIEQRVRAAVPFDPTVEGAEGLDGEVYEIPGSTDCAALPTPEHPDLVVVDLKYGIGHNVDPEENPQLRIYGLGLLSELADEDGNLPDDLDTITYVIAQPRNGGLKTWNESVDDLLDWCDGELSTAMTKALLGPPVAELVPSDLACQWCPARGSCPALVEKAIDSAADLFNVVQDAEFQGEPADPGLLTDDKLGEMLAQANRVVKLQADLKAEAQRRLHRGTPVPGFKLVGYQPPRTWLPGADEAFEDDDLLWGEPKLLSPTQAERLARRGGGFGDLLHRVKELTDTPTKRPVIAPENDRRADWTGAAPEAMFADLTPAELKAAGA